MHVNKPSEWHVRHMSLTVFASGASIIYCSSKATLNIFLPAFQLETSHLVLHDIYLIAS